MFDNLNQYSLIIFIGIVAIILELLLGVATGFELLVIGVVLVAGGGVGLLTGSMTYTWVFIILAILAYIFFGRRMLKQALHITTKKTNIDSIIGKKAQVVAAIYPSAPGQVKIDGEIWRAESEKELSVGKKATILSVSGVTVKVE